MFNLSIQNFVRKAECSRITIGIPTGVLLTQAAALIVVKHECLSIHSWNSKTPEPCLVKIVFVKVYNFQNVSFFTIPAKTLIDYSTQQYSQIRELMCLETHFQFEFLILGRFGQSGLQRKKNQNCHKCATFEASFFMLSWAKMRRH